MCCDVAVRYNRWRRHNSGNSRACGRKIRIPSLKAIRVAGECKRMASFMNDVADSDMVNG